MNQHAQAFFFTGSYSYLGYGYFGYEASSERNPVPPCKA